MRWWPRREWLPARPWRSDVIAMTVAVIVIAALIVWKYWG